MSRIYVDMELAEGMVVDLPPGAYQHLVVVLRRIPGDKVVLFNGRGGEYDVTIESVAKRKCGVRVNAFRDIARESPLPVTLAQAISKGDRMDFSIQKAVELGVSEIQPLITDRVVVRLDAERMERKREHWQSVVISACEQSGRTKVPPVLPALELRDWIVKPADSAMKLVLAPSGAGAAGQLKYSGQHVHLLVGPEGGLTDLELAMCDTHSFNALSFGPRVLRTETAGLVALSVLQSLWGDLGSPKKK